MADQKFRKIYSGSNKGKYEVIGSGRVVSEAQVKAYRASAARRKAKGKK